MSGGKSASNASGKNICSTGAVLDCLASGEPRPDTVWVTAEGVSWLDEDKDEYEWMGLPAYLHKWMYSEDEDVIL